MKSVSGTHLIKINKRISAAKKAGGPKPTGKAGVYTDLHLSDMRRRFPESVSSGQILSQSSGRRSLRDTSPSVALSISTQRSTGIPLLPDAHW
jgi:hypothetical protein